MKLAGLSRSFSDDHYGCSICGNILFEVEPVSKEKVRLTCENCGQCHLLTAISKNKNQLIIKFCDENRNKLIFS
jgi:hypothetical protein